MGLSGGGTNGYEQIIGGNSNARPQFRIRPEARKIDVLFNPRIFQDGNAGALDPIVRNDLRVCAPPSSHKVKFSCKLVIGDS